MIQELFMATLPPQIWLETIKEKSTFLILDSATLKIQQRIEQLTSMSFREHSNRPILS